MKLASIWTHLCIVVFSSVPDSAQALVKKTKANVAEIQRQRLAPPIAFTTPSACDTQAPKPGELWPFKADECGKNFVESAPRGKVLFGSATCPQDVMPIDLMYPFQIRQTSEKAYDRRILYVDHHGKHCEDNQDHVNKCKRHSEFIYNLKTKKLVDEFVQINSINLAHEAEKSMDNKTRALLLQQDPYNKAMTHFLNTCMDSYDHCVWLDSDMFEHRDGIGWVDEAIAESSKVPNLMWSVRPDKPGLFEAVHFSSRAFVYHSGGLRKQLPFKVREIEKGDDDGIYFEEIINRAVFSVFGSWPGSSSSVFGSWSIHPPDDKEEFASIIKTCGPSTLIELVESGKGMDWRDPHSADAMDADRWMSESTKACHKATMLMQMTRASRRIKHVSK